MLFVKNITLMMSLFTIMSLLFFLTQAQNFHMQQIPMNSNSTQLQFQAHFLCDPATQPCDNSWKFAWKGFKPANEDVFSQQDDKTNYDLTFTSSLPLVSDELPALKRVELHIYDIQTYNFTTIIIEDPDDLLSCEKLLDFDFSTQDFFQFNVYGIFEYTTPIPPGIPIATFASQMSLHVYSSTRYVFHLLPGVFDDFSEGIPQLTFAAEPWKNTTSFQSSIATLSSSDSFNNINGVSSKINNGNTFVFTDLTTTPAISPTPSITSHPQRSAISPMINMKFPFYKLSAEMREQIANPSSPQIFNRLYLYLFGYSKWTLKKSLREDYDVGSGDLPKLCFINSTPISCGLDGGAQDQALIILINPTVYASIIRPMIMLNQTDVTIHFNGNYWMYYHYSGDFDDGEDDNNHKIGNDVIIPDESMSIVFTNTQQQQDNTQKSTDGIVNVHSVVNYPQASTWLWIAQVLHYDKKIYENIHSSALSRPTISVTDTSLVTHSQMFLPNTDVSEKWQKTFAKCSFVVDWTDVDFINQFYNPDSIRFTMNINTKFYYSAVEPKSMVPELEGDVKGDIKKALLLILPSSDILKTTELESQPQSWFIPLKYQQKQSTMDGLYHSTESLYKNVDTLELQRNLNELFPNGFFKVNKTDYTYLMNERFTVYYPIDFNDKRRQIDEDSLRCGIDIEYVFEPINLKQEKEQNDANMTHNKLTLAHPLYTNTTIMTQMQKVIWDSPAARYDSVQHNDQHELLQTYYPQLSNKDHFSDEDLDTTTSHISQNVASSITKSDNLIVKEDEYVTKINFVMTEELPQGLNITIEMDLVHHSTQSRIEYITIYPTDGLQYFTSFMYRRDQDEKVEGRKDEGITCTVNQPGWTVIPQITQESFNFLRLAFIQTTPGVVSTNPPSVNILCPKLRIQQTFPRHHDLNKKQKKDEEDERNPPTPPKSTLTSEFSPQYVNTPHKLAGIPVEPSPYNPNEIYKPYKDVMIYDTLLFKFQYRNTTHYSLLEYNIPNPYRSIPQRNMVWIYVIIIFASSVGFILGLAIVRYVVHKCKNEDDSEQNQPYYMSLNYDEDTMRRLNDSSTDAI